MKDLAVTQVIKASIELNKQYSVGFSRLNALPKKVRENLNLASLLNGVDFSKSHQQQKDFLASLSNDEFKNWLKLV